MFSYFLKNKDYGLSLFFLVFVIGINFGFGLFASDVVSDTPGELGIFEKISEQYLPSLASQAHVEELSKAEALMQKTMLTGVGEVETMKLVYKIFSDSRLEHEMGGSGRCQLIEDCVLKDLEIFCGSKDVGNTLFSKIDFTRTLWGRAKLQSRFLKKFNNIDERISEVRDIQKKVKYLIDNEDIFDAIDDQLKRLGSVSSEIMWMWKIFDEAESDYWDRSFFHRHEHKILEGEKKLVVDLTFMNESEFLLGGALFFMVVIAPLVLPVGSAAVSIYNDYALLKVSKDVEIGSISKFMSKIGKVFMWDKWGKKSIFMMRVLSCLLSIYMGIEASRGLLGSVEVVHKKVNNVMSFVDASVGIESILEDSDLFYGSLKSWCDLGKQFVSGDDILEFGGLVNGLLQSDVYEGSISTFINRGEILANFKKIMRMKDCLIRNFLMIGEIDMLMSIAKLYKTYYGRGKVSVCFVDFVKSNLPYLKLKGFWHLFVDPFYAVSNDMEIGTNECGRGAIYTASNAAGKSTALKGLISAVILAHTVGVVPASMATVTPFTKITSHLNVTDEQGRESLFQAEMNRALKFLGEVKNLGCNEFMFVILDELFSSTNPKEGMSGAYGIVNSLVKYPNCMSVLATHFKKLTELEARTNGFFRNYKIDVNIFPDGSYKPTYKVVPGISEQSMALFLMERQGFDVDVVDSARHVMQEVS